MTAGQQTYQRDSGIWSYRIPGLREGSRVVVVDRGYPGARNRFRPPRHVYGSGSHRSRKILYGCGGANTARSGWTDHAARV